MIEVLNLGSTVTIAEDIVAIIESVWVCPGPSILYKVIWWEGKKRNSEWLNDFEVKATKPEIQKIGFK